MTSGIRSEYQPDVVSPPGDTLLEVLEERGISQTQLAQRMGRPVKTINEIIKGKAAIMPETALQLERALGISASFWNDFERRYRENLASQDEKKQLEAKADWLNEVPWRDMARHGWIERHGDPSEQMRELLNFFGVASPTVWETVCTGVAFRKAAAFANHPAAVAAWLRKGEIEARHLECAPYEDQFRGMLPQLRALTIEDPPVYSREMVRLCAAAGVALVFIPELSGTRLCGAARWLTREKAMIQLSLRYKTNDHLWFNFFHEVGHVILHGRKQVFVDFFNGSADEDARELKANRFAADTLIPPSEKARFFEEGDFSEKAILAFAARIRIAPGIVVGRLQHEKLISWNSRAGRLKQRLDLIQE